MGRAVTLHMPAFLRALQSVGSSSRQRLERSIEHLPPGIDASRAVAVVLVELGERLTAGEAHRMVESVPASVRSLVAPCESGRRRGGVHRVDRAEMVARIAKQLGTTPAYAEAIAVDVFSAVRSELPEKIVRDVAGQLPRDIKELWLSEHVRERRDTPVFALGVRASLEREIEERAGLPRGIAPSAAFTAVMAALFERLSAGEALDVLIGLPDELRPLLEGPALDRPERPRTFHRDELFTIVAERLHVARDVAARLVPIVLTAAKRLLPMKEIDDVASQLPADLREIWLAA